VSGNPQLVSLDGLEQLSSVGGATIVYCHELRDLHALGALTSAAQSITVRDNQTLPGCEVDWLKAHLESIGVGFYSEGNDDDAACP
jgi:hypothetical protein